MGIGFVLLGWAIVGIFLAIVGSVILGLLTAFLTRGVDRGRKRVVVAAIAFPFACLMWAGLVFIFQALVNGATGRDPGLGDGWNCPLPNGYAIAMIDVTDRGWVYNPKTQSDGSIMESQDAVAGVRSLQLAGRYIVGSTSDSTLALGASAKQASEVHYFVLDAQTGKKTLFPTLVAARAAVAALGIRLNLEPIDAVYSRYRYTSFDIFVAFLLLTLPLGSLWLLMRQVLELHKGRRTAEVPT